MKSAYYAAVALLCAGFSIYGEAQAANVKPEKSRSIYLAIKGPEEAATRLRALFEKAALDNELFVAPDPHQAGSKIEIAISDERLVERQLYAELLSVTLVPREGDTSKVSFCKQVTDGSGYSTITTSYWAPTKGNMPTHGRIWIEHNNRQRGLAELVRKKITEAGFQMAASASEADITLKDIQLIKVPFEVTALEAKVQSELNIAGGFVTTLSSDVKNYFPVKDPISTDAEGCRNSIQRISNTPSSGYEQVVSLDLALIAGWLKK